MEKWSSRESHKLKVRGSNPLLASKLNIILITLKTEQMKNLTVSTKDIRHNMTDVQLLQTIKELKTMLKFAKLEYQIRNY